MTAAAAKPSIRRARARRFQCKTCGIAYEPNAEHACDPRDVAAMRRARREGALPDARHQILIPLPDKDVPMTQWRRDRLELVVLRSRASEVSKETARALLKHIDFPTLIYFLGTRGLAEETGYSRRVVRKGLEDLARRGVILRSTADDAASAKNLRHLHYDAHDQRLVQPTKWRPASTEWNEGVRLYEWVIMEENRLAAALSQAAPPDRLDPGGADLHDPGGEDRTDPRGADQRDPGSQDRRDPGRADPHDPRGPDPEDPAFHRRSLRNDPSLDPDPSLNPHFSAPSAHRGDLAIASATPTEEVSASPTRAFTTAATPPGGAAAPRAPRLPSDTEASPPHENPRGKSEGLREGECNIRTVVVVPDGAEEPETGSPDEAETAETTPAAEWARRKAIVVSAIAAAAKLRRSIDAGLLLGRLANLRRAGYRLEELELVVAGVLHGTSDYATTARGHAFPFAYAFSDKKGADLIRTLAHDGRKHAELELEPSGVRSSPEAERAELAPVSSSAAELDLEELERRAAAIEELDARSASADDPSRQPQPEEPTS